MNEHSGERFSQMDLPLLTESASCLARMDNFEEYSLEAENRQLAAEVIRLEGDVRRLEQDKLRVERDLAYAHEQLREVSW